MIAMNYYTNGEDVNLLWICSGLVVFFTVFSLLLVNGNNRKMHAAILASVLVGSPGAAMNIAIPITAWLTAYGMVKYKDKIRSDEADGEEK